MSDGRFNHKFPSCNRTYATLCMYHDQMEPDEITMLIGLNPDRTVGKGQQLSLGRVATRNGWFFSTRDKSSSKDVRYHIHLVLETIIPKQRELFEFKDQGFEIRIVCFWESAAGNGGPILDHELIGELAKVPVDVDFDIWFASEDKESDLRRRLHDPIHA